MDRQKTIAAILVPVAVLAMGASWQAFRGPSKAQDAASLKKQMAAAGRMGGMPGGPPGGFDPRQMQGRMLDNMAKELGLSGDQKSKIGSIQETTRPGMRQIMDDSALFRDQKRQKMDQLRKDQEAQIKAVLTSDQQSKYDEMQKRMRERMQQMRAAMGGGPDGPMGPPPDGMMGGPPPGNGPADNQGPNNNN